MPNGRERAQELLTRAAAFRWLARAFSYPAPGHVEQLKRMYRNLAAPARRQLPRAARPMRAALREVETTAPEDLAARYLRFFSGRAAVSLHETAYGDGRRAGGQSVELADLNGFYAAFGLALSPHEPDLPDHLCTELEFYSLLLIKEAYARTRRWRPKERIARDAASTFLEQHLGRWLGALRSSLEENQAAPYLALADAAVALAEAECRRLRARPEPCFGRAPHDATQDESFVCPHGRAATAL